MSRKLAPAPKRPYVRVTSWRRRRFFAVLAETGTVKVAAELAGLGIGAIYRLRKLEPGFRERMEAAIATGTARLEEAQEAPPSRSAGSPSPAKAARTAYSQMRRRPGFAALCERAITEAKPRLEDLLALQSARWSRAACDEAFGGEPLDERDIDRALRTLEYWERQRRRRAAGRG